MSTVVNYWATWRVSCDWACHRARGSAGGTDYAVGVGTPIRASFDGVLTNFYSSATNLARAVLRRPDGMAFYHLHLSAFADGTHNLGSPRNVRQGDVIGFTGGRVGAWGAGTANGPHLHANAFDANGVIRDVHDYFTTTAGSGSTPLIGDDVSFTDPISKSTTPAQNTAGDYLIYARQDAGTAVGILDGAIPVQKSALPAQNALTDFIIYTREDVASIKASMVALTAAVQALATAKGIDGPALVADIVSKVDAALADNFAAIPGATIAGLKAAL